MLAFTMQVVKLELAATAPDVMYASSETNQGVFKLLSRGDQPIFAVFSDEVCNRLADMELVGIRVGFLRLLKLQDRPGAKFKVLLRAVPA